MAQLYVHGDSLQVRILIDTKVQRLTIYVKLSREGNFYLLVLHSEARQIKMSDLVLIFKWNWLFNRCFLFQSCLVGIVVPDPDVMPEWAKKKGIVGTYKDLCKNTVGRS